MDKQKKNFDGPLWVKSKTGQPLIQCADGTFAKTEEAQKLVFWPSIRLRIQFGGWYRYYHSDWQKKVAAFVFQRTKLARFSWIHQETDPISHWTAAVLRPLRFNQAVVKKWVLKNIFKTHPEDPLLLLRTGDQFSVHYNEGLLIFPDRVELYLPPTEKNVKLLEKMLDDIIKKDLAAKISFQFADISYGLCGWLYPFTQFSKNILFMSNPEKNSPIYGANWRLYVGDLWRATPKHSKILEILQKNSYKLEEEKNFMRITVPRPSSFEDTKGAESARKLREDFTVIIKKMASLDGKMLQPIIEKEEKVLIAKLKKKYGKQ